MRTRRVWLAPGEEPEAAPGWVLVRAVVVRRQYRTVGYRSRRTGRLTTLAAFRRWPGKIAAVRRLVRLRWELTERREKKGPPEPAEVWELTVSYKGAKRVEDITVRMVAVHPGRRYRPDDLRRAFWVAHKQGPDALTEWTVEALDWRGYTYPSERVSLGEAFQNAGGIFTTVGMEAVRVARVEA